MRQMQIRTRPEAALGMSIMRRIQLALAFLLGANFHDKLFKASARADNFERFFAL